MLKEFLLETINDKISVCQKCELHQHRTKTVPGDGNPDAKLLICSEAPGQEEDKQGKVLVGPAGQMFTKWMNFIDIDRKDIFHLNTVKCRPYQNRNPLSEEIEACRWYLEEQLELVKPKVILLLGSIALKTMLKDQSAGIMRMRGKWLNYNNVATMPTYHPAFLLRQMTRENQEKVQSDLLQVKEKLKELS
tara:strand:+ start:138 stop:710 length:573 start_codon:yes stop_codon:yes gene_type:complete